jgi:zinc transport system substrate-binding protein
MMVVINVACTKTQEGSHNQIKPIVAVSTFALYDATKYIAQESVKIVKIIPFGVDPHSFEPTPKVMAQLEHASVVFYNGAGLEPWTEGFHFHAKAIDMSHFVHLRKLQHHHHKQEGVKEHHHHHGIDPHYWLDFKNMKIVVHKITQELSRLVPSDQVRFEQREKEYDLMLNMLEQKYSQTLSSCQKDTVVISHNALGYLAQKYHFHVESLSGLSPEAQPSVKDITRIMQDIHSKGVGTIFFEHFVNDRIIKSIAKDSNVTLEVFQPMGNITADEAKAHLTYKDIMERNLQKLAKALECK